MVKESRMMKTESREWVYRGSKMGSQTRSIPKESWEQHGPKAKTGENLRIGGDRLKAHQDDMLNLHTEIHEKAIVEGLLRTEEATSAGTSVKWFDSAEAKYTHSSKG